MAVAHRRIRRTSGNLERFAAKYGVRQSVTVEYVGEAYVISADAELYLPNAEALYAQIVYIEPFNPRALEGLCKSAVHQALSDLAGRFNVWVEQREEGAP